MKPRKLTAEQAARINRLRDLLEGPPSFEGARPRVTVGEDGRPVVVDATMGEWPEPR